MKTFVKVICVVLVLVIFAAMAIGSGSKKGTENDTAVNNTKDTIPSENKTDTKEDTKKETQQPKEEYEVGNGRAVIYTSSIGTTWVQVSIPVKNTGSVDLYMSSCSVDLVEDDGHLFESLSLVSVYPQVIKPGETAWYYEETTLDNAPSGNLKVQPHVNAKKATVDCVRYEVSEVEVTNDKYSGIKITGWVENTTSEEASLPYVVVFMYDANDELIGQAFSIISDGLKPGDKKGFSMSTFSSYDQFIAENVKRVEYYSYPTQFQFN